MLTWAFLCQFNETNPPTCALGRSISVQKKYDTFRDNIIQNYGNVSNYLEETLFVNEEPFIIKKNDFPYNTTSNIDHYLLWINPKYNSYFTNKSVKKQLELFFENKYIFFKNNSNNMSIQSITHYHIFIKH